MHKPNKHKREIIVYLQVYSFFSQVTASTMSSIRGGFGAGTTSCKCHEMSSKKKVCGEGWVKRGSTYLKREGLGLGLESLLYPSRLGLGWGLYLWRRVAPWPCGKTH